MTYNELKPCPFCGAKMEVRYAICRGFEEFLDGYSLYHPDNECILTGWDFTATLDCFQEVISMWNTRKSNEDVNE